MSTPGEQLQHHAPHGLRGPHVRNDLTADERAELRRWLDASEKDPQVGVRELAEYIATIPVLDRAVRGAARAALWGGMQPSSATHAVAMLGLRRTRQLLEALAPSSERFTARTTG